MEKIQREKRSLEDLNVIDDFLMNAAASDREDGEEFCRLILSTLLEREVGKIHINTQKVISAGAPNLRGIRMDVEIIESAGELINVYDIEPCRYHKRGLEKSNRFYQAKIDSRYMESGERDFTKLPNLYIITILPYDPFGENYMMYQIINQCLEVRGLNIKTDCGIFILIQQEKMGGSPAIRELLQYFQNSTETNARSERLQRIHEHVKKVKVLPEMREEFMRLDDIIYYEREEADQNRAVQDILELLEDCGEVSEELKNKIKVQTDKETLRRWHKLAARAESLEEFKTKM